MSPSPPHAGESLYELRILRARFEQHALNFKDWLRHGGPVEPIWARETIALRRELHRAQCRAARRVYESEQVSLTRCLGALQVYRVQRPPKRDVTGQQRRQRQQQQQQDERGHDPDHRRRPRHLEELAMCKQTGKFERFGDVDIAFVCDFCDGYLVWEDLREMPSVRAGALPPGGDGLEPLSATNSPLRRRKRRPAMAGTEAIATATKAMTTATKTASTTTTETETDTDTETGTETGTETSGPTAADTQKQQPPLEDATDAADAAAAPDQWQATGFARSTGAEKAVVHAPTAIASHRAPGPGEWQAPLLCPFCDEWYYEGAGEDAVFERVRYAQDEAGFPSVADFQLHLEWHHTSIAMSLPVALSQSLSLAGGAGGDGGGVPADAASNCIVI